MKSCVSSRDARPAPWKLPKPEWRKVDFNPLKFGRQLQERIQIMRISQFTRFLPCPAEFYPCPVQRPKRSAPCIPAVQCPTIEIHLITGGSKEERRPHFVWWFPSRITPTKRSLRPPNQIIFEKLPNGGAFSIQRFIFQISFGVFLVYISCQM